MSAVNRNRQIAARLSKEFGSDWIAHYVYWKVRTDPVYEAVASRLEATSLPVLDVGCGVGVLAFYLRLAGMDVPIEGLDLDVKKIGRAQEVAGRDGFEDIEFRAERVELVEAIPGHVTLLDVVHYLEDVPQAALLRSVAGKVPPGARVILRTTLADGSWRARVTWLEEVFARATGWMRTTTINFPTRDEIDACFPADQFRRTITPLWGRTPFNSHLLEYERVQADM